MIEKFHTFTLFEFLGYHYDDLVLANEQFKHVSVRFQKSELKVLYNFIELETANSNSVSSTSGEDLITFFAVWEGGKGETHTKLMVFPSFSLRNYIETKQENRFKYYTWYEHMLPLLDKFGYHSFFSPYSPDPSEDMDVFVNGQEIYLVSANDEKHLAPNDFPVYSIEEYNQEVLALGKWERLISEELIKRTKKISTPLREEINSDPKMQKPQSGVNGLINSIPIRKLRHRVYKILRELYFKDFESKIIFSHLLNRKFIIVPQIVHKCIGHNELIITEEILDGLEKIETAQPGLLGSFQYDNQTIDANNPVQEALNG